MFNVYRIPLPPTSYTKSLNIQISIKHSNYNYIKSLRACQSENSQS